MPVIPQKSKGLDEPEFIGIILVTCYCIQASLEIHWFAHGGRQIRVNAWTGSYMNTKYVTISQSQKVPNLSLLCLI